MTNLSPWREGKRWQKNIYSRSFVDAPHFTWSHAQDQVQLCRSCLRKGRGGYPEFVIVQKEGQIIRCDWIWTKDNDMQYLSISKIKSFTSKANKTDTTGTSLNRKQSGQSKTGKNGHLYVTNMRGMKGQKKWEGSILWTLVQHSYLVLAYHLGG